MTPSGPITVTLTSNEVHEAIMRAERRRRVWQLRSGDLTSIRAQLYREAYIETAAMRHWKITRVADEHDDRLLRRTRCRVLQSEPNPHDIERRQLVLWGTVHGPTVTIVGWTDYAEGHDVRLFGEDGEHFHDEEM